VQTTLLARWAGGQRDRRILLSTCDCEQEAQVRQGDTAAPHLQGSFRALGTGQVVDGQLGRHSQMGALSRDFSDGLRTGFHLDCALSCGCLEACLRAQT
jgi:hypothetical protein